MTEIRPDASSQGGLVAPQFEDDLRALGETTSVRIPDLEHSVTAVQSRRRHAVQRWREYLMPITNTFTRRPWLTTAGIAAAAVLALTVVPISYQRTTGTDVALTVAGVNDLSRSEGIANEMKTVLGAQQIAIKAEMADAGAALTLSAFVPASSGVNAAARANALAKELNARGYAAHVVATPHVERVSGNVYAFAKDLVIRVETDGKSASQIEAEIRQRLADNGITNTQVSVTDTGKERKVTIEAQRFGEPGASEPGKVSLELMKNGQSTIGDGVSVEVKKIRSPDGVTMNLEVTSKGQTTSVTVPHADTMSDAALAAEITSQLRAAGQNLDVRVSNGQIEIGRNN